MLTDEQLEHHRPHRGIGTIGKACLLQALYAIVVELDTEARNLLTKGNEWLLMAIETKEQPGDRYVEHECESSLLLHLGLTRWLLHGEAQPDIFFQASEHLVQLYSERKEWSFHACVVPFACCLKPEYIINQFNRHQIRKPHQNHIKRDSDMIWLICLHQTSGVPNREECLEAMDRTLARQLPVCMGMKNGLLTWIDLGFWMYLYHQSLNPALSAFEAIRKVHQYAPLFPSNGEQSWA